MGGTLYQMSPMVAAAAMRFDERIALMPALYRRALGFASALHRHPRLRVNPQVPQANLLHLHFDAPAEAAMQARDALAEEAGCWLFDNVRPVDVPGRSVTEIYVGDRLLAIEDARIGALFERLVTLLPDS